MYRCLITYIRKTKTVIYFGRTNLNFDILQYDFDAKLCEIWILLIEQAFQKMLKICIKSPIEPI